MVEIREEIAFGWTPAEMTQFQERCGGKRATSRGAAQSGEAAAARQQRLFTALDRDGDGAISRQDFQQALLSDDVGPQALSALGSGTAMEAARARRAHSEALQEERQRRLEDFRRACQRRVAARATRQTGGDQTAAPGKAPVATAAAAAASPALTQAPHVPQPTVQFLDPTRGVWMASTAPPAGGLPALRQFLLQSHEQAMKSLASPGTKPPVLEEPTEAAASPAPAEQQPHPYSSFSPPERGSCDGNLSAAAERFAEVVEEAVHEKAAELLAEREAVSSVLEAEHSKKKEEDAAEASTKKEEDAAEVSKKKEESAAEASKTKEEAAETSSQELQEQRKPPALAAADSHAATAGKTSATKSSRPEGDRSSRYTSGLLSLMVRAYAKRGRPAPRLCACLPVPEGPAPSIASDGNLSQSPAWEAFIQKVSNPERHARNCEFAQSGLSKLQRQVLLLIQAAKEQ